MKKPKITIDDNCVFLTLDLYGLDLYERGKAIRHFVDRDTLILEDYVDELIKGCLERNDIIVTNKDKSVLKQAFDSLKAKNKDIKVINFYGSGNLMGCRFIDCKHRITTVIEDNRYLQAGIEVKEIEL